MIRRAMNLVFGLGAPVAAAMETLKARDIVTQPAQKAPRVPGGGGGSSRVFGGRPANYHKKSSRRRAARKARRRRLHG